jgi:gamma-glutamyltranspeptidase / glutathione hydrolase
VTKVAVATTSALAADAAREVAAAGGNAVDCAIGAALMSMNTQPGVCALAGGAYVTLWAPDEPPVTFDGNHAVPGRGLAGHDPADGVIEVTLDYGGGVATRVGSGTVAIPGALAALEAAWRRHGECSWRELFVPAIRATSEGFPLPAACHYYLCYSDRDIFGRSPDARRALHDERGALLGPGDPVVVPHLADSLASIADGGARMFYEGDLARAMSGHVLDGGGALTMADLAEFEAVERPALTAELHGWRIATNPPPAIGGAVLAAMLLACADLPSPRWDRASLERLIRVQRACLDYRQRRFDAGADLGVAAAGLIAAARDGRLLRRWSSASTVHTSTVDDAGLACSITASSGYGSGEMPADTGLWLNNGLGEIELMGDGSAAGAPGTRLPSNMAPSIARLADDVLAIGSPGADRITSAIHQVLVNTLELGMSLADAISHPRLHVDTSGTADRLAAEPGLDLPEVDLPVHVFPDLNMYFGGVGAARANRAGGFDVASDPRREGGTAVCGR